jgi:hypothetical protein
MHHSPLLKNIHPRLQSLRCKSS